MTKSKFITDKLAKLFEQGLISYKDLNAEILNILNSKKNEIILKLELPTKEEFDILKKRVEKVINKKVSINFEQIYSFFGTILI